MHFTFSPLHRIRLGMLLREVGLTDALRHLEGINPPIPLLRDAFTSLAEPIRTQAEKLLARAFLFKPLSYRLSKEGQREMRQVVVNWDFDRSQKDPSCFDTLVRLVKERSPVLVPILNREFDQQHSINFDIIHAAGGIACEEYAERLGLIRLKSLFNEDVFAGNRYGPRGIMDRISKDGIDDLRQLIDYILTHVRNPVNRFYVLRLAGHLCFYRLDLLERSAWSKMLRRAIRDREPLNVLMAWRALHDLDSSDAKTVTQADLSCGIPPVIRRVPEFGIERYVYGTPFQRCAWRDFVHDLRGYSRREDASLPLTRIRPIHSLADYNPDPDMRNPVMMEHYERLRELIDQLGWHLALDQYFRKWPMPNILKIGEDFYLIDMHHRFAPLFYAAACGIVPKGHLNLPIVVKIMTYKGNLPEAIVRRITTIGVELYWKDLFPPS